MSTGNDYINALLNMVPGKTALLINRSQLRYILISNDSIVECFACTIFFITVPNQEFDERIVNTLLEK